MEKRTTAMTRPGPIVWYAIHSINPHRPQAQTPVIKTPKYWQTHLLQILGSIATDFSSAIYCAVVTHDGQKNNGFTECKDDTVNQNGQGAYDVNKTEGLGKEPGPGRKLLDHLELNN